ncbi:MAG: helix-hairpin-helix domain-containing protein [Pseudomonadota bacterium]
MKNPFLDSLPFKDVTTLMAPGKWMALVQAQQADAVQTSMAALGCRDPMTFMALQQSFVQRTIERWTTAAKEAAKGEAKPAPALAAKPAPQAVAKPAAPAPSKRADVVSLVEQQIEKAKETIAAAEAAQADDLTVIKGIGPKFAATLADHGITSFRKLASLTDAEIEQLEQKLGFNGRFAREGWVEQAKVLATH